MPQQYNGPQNFDLSTALPEEQKVRSVSKSPTLAKVMDRKFLRQSPRGENTSITRFKRKSPSPQPSSIVHKPKHKYSIAIPNDNQRTLGKDGLFKCPVGVVVRNGVLEAVSMSLAKKLNRDTSRKNKSPRSKSPRLNNAKLPEVRRVLKQAPRDNTQPRMRNQNIFQTEDN